MTSSDSPTDRPPVRRIIVGVDGSKASIDALHWAIGRAAELGAEVTAVATWHFPPFGLERPSKAQSIHEETSAMLDEAIASARSNADSSVQITPEVYQAAAARRLIDMSRKADLVVIGRRSTRPPVGLGSVSEHVAGHAHCPVVVIPSLEES